MIVNPCKFPFNSIKHQGKIPMFMVILIAKSFPTFPATSPWKKCTIVAGSAAGSRLPTKELSTRTAPQGASKRLLPRTILPTNQGEKAEKLVFGLGNVQKFFLEQRLFHTCAIAKYEATFSCPTVVAPAARLNFCQALASERRHSDHPEESLLGH